MTNKYDKYLTSEQKVAIVTQKLQQFAVEAFQHELSKKVFVAMGDSSGVELSENLILQLETAISIAETELNSFS